MTTAALVPVSATDDTRRVVRRSLLGQAMVFALGVLSAVQVANVTLTLLSLVSLLLVPVWLLMRHRGVDLVPVVLGVVGWLSFLASCLVNHTSILWPNAMAPAGFSLYLIGFTALTGRAVDRIALLMAGISVGTIGFFLFQGISLTHTGHFLDLWKYGIAHALTVLLLFALAKARVPVLVPGCALVLLSLISLVLNFRSHALVSILAGATLLCHRFLGSRIRQGWQFAGIAGLGLGFAYLMPIAARLGLFGSALQRKTLELDTTHLPILLAGRTEPPMTITAILERPLLGWGNATNFTPDLYTKAAHLAVQMGYSPTFEFDIYWRLPVFDYSATHSILLGSWAEGGILAALLPLWLLFASLGIVWRYNRFGLWAPLALTMALQAVWDLIYGPWTYNMLAEHACIALLFCAVYWRRVSPPA